MSETRYVSTAKSSYQCAHCGGSFIWVPRRARPPVTCSDECREARLKRKNREKYAKRLVAQRLRRKRGSPYLSLACDVEGCERPAYAKHLCDLHYNRKRRLGEVGPSGYLKKPASDRYTTGRSGYIQLSIRDESGRVVRRPIEHRYVMEQILGRPLLDHESVHHLNGVRGDNRPENLELWVKPQPAGQRPEDLAAWVVEFYPEMVEAALDGRRQLRLIG